MLQRPLMKPPVCEKVVWQKLPLVPGNNDSLCNAVPCSNKMARQSNPFREAPTKGSGCPNGILSNSVFLASVWSGASEAGEVDDDEGQDEEDKTGKHLRKYLFISFGETSIHHMVQSHAKQLMVEIENLRLGQGLVGEVPPVDPRGGCL